jgi:hypothetical protein
VSQNFQDGLMLNCVKGFSKIKLYNEDWQFGLLTLKNILISPCQTVLDSSRMNEPILILMNTFENMIMESISCQFCQELQTHIGERYRSIVIDRFRGTFLWDKCYVRSIDIL